MLRSVDSFTNKAKQLEIFMIKNVGLRNPCEKTRRMMVVIIHLASKVDLDPEACLDHIEEMRLIYEAKRGSYDAVATMPKFPSDVQEFMRLFPTAYDKEHPPAASALDVTEVKERCHSDVTPARSSNRLVRRMPRKGKPPQSSLAAAPSCTALVPYTAADMSHQVQLQQLQLLRDFMHGRSSTVPPIAAASASATLPAPSAPGSLAIDDRKPADGSAATPAHGDAGGGVPGCLAAKVTEKPTPADKMAELRQKIKDDLNAAKAKKKAKAKADVTKPKKKHKALLAAAAAAHKADEPEDSASDDKESDDSPGGDSTVDDKADGDKAAPKKNTKAKAKAKSKGILAEKEQRFKELFKRPASKARPKFSKKPTAYGGGKIYWSGAKKALRVYRRTPQDKVEESVKFDEKDNADTHRAWSIACALIETHPRAVPKDCVA